MLGIARSIEQRHAICANHRAEREEEEAEDDGESDEDDEYEEDDDGESDEEDDAEYEEDDDGESDEEDDAEYEEEDDGESDEDDDAESEEEDDGESDEDDEYEEEDDGESDEDDDAESEEEDDGESDEDDDAESDEEDDGESDEDDDAEYEEEDDGESDEQDIATLVIIDEREVVISLNGVSSLDVESKNGQVVVEATEDDAGRLAGTAIIRCGGSDASEARARCRAALLRLDSDNGTAIIRVVFPPASSERVGAQDGASFGIGVPALDGVLIVTTNGRVVSRGFGGLCGIRTSNAGVVVAEHDGPIDIRTSNGKVAVEGFEPIGTVSVRTSNAPIRVVAHDALVRLDLNTSNGNIEASLPLQWSGVIEAQTSNDTIAIRSPAGFLTSNDGHQRAAVGSGRASLTAITSNATIDVRIG